MKIKQYKLTCITLTAIHIGTQQRPDDAVDSLFRRTADGRIVIPGTGIAGAFRSHLTRIIPAMSGLSVHQTICEELNMIEAPIDYAQNILYHLMGDSEPDRSETSRASRLIVNDGVVLDQNTQIRDGVGIDRIMGTASRQAQSKFDIETLPIGSRIAIQLLLEDYEDNDEYLVDLALSELNAGRIRLGGNTSRGLGRVVIDSLESRVFDLAQPDQLMSYLHDDESIGWDEQAVITPARKSDYFGDYRPLYGSVQHWLHITFDLQGQGFFLTNDATHATSREFSHYSTAYPPGKDGLPFIPGSGLRGTIRSQAERIARTITNNRVDSEADFLRHVAASDPFVMHWAQYEEGLESTTSRIDRHPSLPEEITRANHKYYEMGEAFFNLFDLSEQLFGTTFHGSRLHVSDALLAQGTTPIWKKLDFVAIDRFTGGAADKMKFDAYALWQPRFTCELYFEAPRAWEIGWLMQVIQDMQAGLVTIGFGAAKGFGDVRLENLKVTLGYTHPETFGLELPIQPDQFFSTFSANVDDALTVWQDNWLDTVLGYVVPDELPHDKFPDPYWGSNQRRYTLADLYDRMRGAK